MQLYHGAELNHSEFDQVYQQLGYQISAITSVIKYIFIAYIYGQTLDSLTKNRVKIALFSRQR